MFRKKRDRFVSALSENIMHDVRSEYTVMPRFAFHQLLDYHESTLPPVFGTPIIMRGEPLPVPAGEDRFGYLAEDTNEYLRWENLTTTYF
jgi:hypothetical protein